MPKPDAARTTLRIRDLILSVDAMLGDDPDTAIAQQLAKTIGAQQAKQASQIVLARRALDARRGRTPRFVISVDATFPADTATELLKRPDVNQPHPAASARWTLDRKPAGPRPVVVGAGPAGLFAALTLTEAGWAPIIIERGSAVEKRAKDVSKLYSRGVLNEESNVCFGEGGAGTFSDGKLYTRVNDPRVQRTLRMLVANGANPDILVHSRPHLGTDKLVKLLKTIRQYLKDHGATFHFDTRVADIDVDGGALRRIVLADGTKLDATHAVIATGHSARDMWSQLKTAGVALEARPFAVGFRVEHPQPLIDTLRYGENWRDRGLPAADYRLSFNQPSGDKRGVYSFCMCPGGVVVTTPTEPGALCINGMSHAARSGRFANSALVVTVGPEDFQATGPDDLFAGVRFLDAIETRAYEAGGGDFQAPAARLTDFKSGHYKRDLGATTYRRGLTRANLDSLYPTAVTQALRDGLQHFEKKMPGFLTSEATLIGVETRTASPIRVLRDPESLEAIGASGLYPAGEGMGYGGGIMSAAVDGMRCAEALLQKAGARQDIST